MKLLLTSLLLVYFMTTTAQEVVPETPLDTIVLNEVIVKAQRKTQYTDKASFTFEKKAVEQARYAKDLLRSLPNLHLNPVTNQIATLKRGTLLVLVNGVEATDLQIRGIAPQNVARIDYYDIPPARWSNRADTVVDIITRSAEEGYSVGVDALSALTTGFLDASAYGNYTKGKHTLGVEYKLEFRDYNNRHYEKHSDYELSGVRYANDQQSKSGFSYNAHNASVRYSAVVPQNYSFQAKAEMELLNRSAYSNGINLFTQGTTISHHTLSGKSHDHWLRPKVDLYFSKKLGKRDELSVNVVGSYYNTTKENLSKEWVTSTAQNVYNDDMDLKVKQRGWVGEVAHTHQFDIGKLNSGYRISSTFIDNDLRNLAGTSAYDVTYTNQYLYTEFVGKKANFMYRASAGLTHTHNRSAENTFTEWVFTPKVVLGYELANNQSLRLTSYYVPRSPRSAELSSNIAQQAPNILETGNPYLKSQHIFWTGLSYTFNNEYTDFNLQPFYKNTQRVITDIYIKDPVRNGILSTYENSKYHEEFGFSLDGTFKPLRNDLFVFSANIAPTRETLVTDAGLRARNNYIDNNLSLTFTYKDLRVDYSFNFPIYYIDGNTMSTYENNNDIFIEYQLGSWTLKGGVFWLGMPSEYKMKSSYEGLVNQHSYTYIENNRNMFVLGVSYDFSKGKNNSVDKKLNNDTAPAAQF